jgi:hypothetical protein
MTYFNDKQLAVLARGTLGVLLLGALAVQPAAAQAMGRTEVFVGYSLLRAEPDVDLDPFGMNGVHIEVFHAISERWGPVLDVSGHTGAVDAPPTAYGVSRIEIGQFAFMAGIRRNGARWGPMRLAGRVLIGVSRGTVETDVSQSLWVEETAFAAALGGSLMLDVSDRITVRLIQPNFLMTTFGNETQWSQRVSSGLVLSF